MAGFEDLKLSWNGVEYTVPANRLMPLIQTVEDIIQGDGQMQAGLRLLQGKVTNARMAAAYAAALRHAGATTVTQDEVYLVIQEDLANGGRDGKTVDLQEWSIALLMMMSPPLREKLTGADDADPTPEK